MFPFAIFFVLYLLLILLLYQGQSEKNYDHLSPIKKENGIIVQDQIIIIGTVDGNLHAIDSSFRVSWTTSTGNPLTYAEYSEKTESSPTHTAIPTLDGSIFLHEEEGMKKTSVKARVMTENTPFMTKDGLLFTGKKQSRVMGIDLQDGTMMHDISTDFEGKLPFSAGGGGSTASSSHQNSFTPKLPKSHAALIGRIDYLLKATNTETGLDEFSISYSELIPLFTNMATAGSVVSADGISHAVIDPLSTSFKRMHPTGTSPISSNAYLLSNPNGGVMFYDDQGIALHKEAIALSSPAVNAFVISLVDAKPKFHFKLPIHYSLHNFRSFHKIKPSLAEPGRHNSLTGSSLITRANQHVGKLKAKDTLGFTHHDEEDDEQLVLVQSIKKVKGNIGENAIYGMEFLAEEDFVEFDEVDERRALPSPEVREKDPEEESPVKVDQLERYEQNKQFFSRHYNSLSLPTIKSRGKNLPSAPLCSSSNSTFCDSSSLLAVESEGDRKPELLRELLQATTELSRMKDQFKDIKGIHKIKSILHFDPEKSLEDPSWVINLLDSPSLRQKHHRDHGESHSRSEEDKPRREHRKRTVFEVIKSVIEGLAVLIVVLLGMSALFEKTILGKYLQEILPLPAWVIGLLNHSQHQLVPRNELASSSSSVSEKTPVEEEIVEYINGKKVSRVGSLYVSDTVLGYGSCGTVVFFGRLNGRSVAVKRMLSQFHKSADREISMLIKSDGHPNVVRYFLKEEKNDFVYLGLQLCEMSLKEFVTNLRTSVEETNTLTSYLQTIDDEIRVSLLQVAEGLAYLHARKIVHRDIKPHNILCANIQDYATDDDWMSQKSVVIHSLKQLANYILKISDMGLSKQLDKNEHSFSSFSMLLTQSHHQHNHNHRGENGGEGHENGEQQQQQQQQQQHHLKQNIPTVVGTIGWQAPELIRTSNRRPEVLSQHADNHSNNTRSSGITQSQTENSITSITSTTGKEEVEDSQILIKPATELSEDQLNNRRTLNVDVFSLGCVFYYTLTLGEHPYGDWYEREANIITNKMNLSAIDRFPDAIDLISSMLHPDSSFRPSSVQVCNHPFFWTSAKRLEFLTDFSDRLEKEVPDSAMILELERGAMTVISGKWEKKLDHALLEDVGKYRKYDTSSVRDLLRLIRNKRHHFHELSEAIKEKMGSIPNGFYSYFDSRYPYLLIHCARVANRFLRKEDFLLNWQNEQQSSLCLSSSSLLTTPAMSAKGGGVAASAAASITTEKTAFSSPTRSTLNALEGVMPADGDIETELFSPFSPSGNVKESIAADTEDASVSTGVTTIGGTTNSTTNSSYTSDQIVDIIIWNGSTLQATLKSKGWWRDTFDWIHDHSGNSKGISGSNKKSRANHLTKAAADHKYRTRLCTHWEATNGGICPMRKKGKCIFAHGPLELRVKETRRDKWGKGNAASITASSSLSPIEQLRYSGGEDTLNAARSIEKVRAVEGSFSEFERTSVYSGGPSPAPPAPTLHNPYMKFDPNAPAFNPSANPYMMLPPNVQFVQDSKTGAMGYYYMPPPS